MRLSFLARERISSKFSSGPPNGSLSHPIRILLQLALITSTAAGSCGHGVREPNRIKKIVMSDFTAWTPFECARRIPRKCEQE
jgi:hypothetical protein